MKEMRIVMLGKRGVGKSSAANTILGENVFQIGHTGNSETSECQSGTRHIDGIDITLIETPGFFILNPVVEKVIAVTVKCITECATGIHAFLIVIEVEPFTQQQQEVITLVNQYFSAEAFKYAILLFTHGDQLQKNQTVEEYFHRNQPLSDLMKKCGGRCHVIDNKYWKDMRNQVQVKKLLETIYQMRKKNKKISYTNKMLEDVQKLIQEEEEKIRKSPGNMTEEEIREEAKKRTSGRLLKHLRGFTVSKLFGAFLGDGAPVGGRSALRGAVGGGVTG